MTIATPDASAERFVRVCPKHQLPLIETRGDALRCPAGHIASSWAVIDRQKVRLDMEDLRKKPLKRRVIARAKLEDTLGHQLWVYAVVVHGDAYRVTWQHSTIFNKARSTGISEIVATEKGLIDAHLRAVARAKASGWKEVPIKAGNSTLVLRPIPAPGAEPTRTRGPKPVPGPAKAAVGRK